MKCPACDNALEAVKVNGITVDVCAGGCAGIWFDNFELEKVDESHEAAGERFLEVERNGRVAIDHERSRTCPRCDDQIMMRHFFSVNREVEVDECPACGGFWLDQGELRTIRTQYASEEERKQAAHDYFQDVFGEELQRMGAESEENLQKAQRIARMFRFICPSNYIPGEQSWGAY